MMLFRKLSLLFSCLWSPLAFSHSKHDAPEQDPLSAEHLDMLEEKWGVEWGFVGISTFAHLPHVKCLTRPDEPFDIGIIGAPFDTATSYRPGARFGPRAIRAASARQSSFRGFNPRAGFNPYTSWATILDCGDMPITPFDNTLAFAQMTAAFHELGTRTSASPSPLHKTSRLLTLGGDHSIALPTLRALSQIHAQPIAVLHFDAHLDTWRPTKYPGAPTWQTEQNELNHGSMFWKAATEGLIRNGSSVHAGLRTRLTGDDWADYADDDAHGGWLRIATDDIDDVGVAGVVKAIMERIGTDTPTYLSVDIDVLDPGLAPGTGTPEPGGWSTRELIRVLRGVEGLNVVGADIVEVAPAYDTRGESTALAAAQVAFEILTSMVMRGRAAEGEEVGREMDGRGWKRDEL